MSAYYVVYAKGKGERTMQKLIIEGERKLGGSIKVHGAKNSALPILAATFLSGKHSVLHNCPRLSDVFAVCRILSFLGCRCSREDDTVIIDSSQPTCAEVPDGLMREMRSSIVFLGAILGRLGKCRLSFPGGCELGPRPIDMHLSSLRLMGAQIRESHGVLDCDCSKGVVGTVINLSFPSVGATENIMLAAVLAKGETVIRNAAREPEISDLADYLNACGAKITGQGTGTIRIHGVKALNGAEYTVMPDRIVAATYMGAAAITGSELTLTGVRPSDFDSTTALFEQMGCSVYCYSDKLYISAKKPLKAVKTIRTMPYPGFPTDVQAIAMAVLTQAHGTSVIVENIFESRYKHVDELCRMGADIKAEGRVAIIEGVKRLSGAAVKATDLRGGAALVLAGLAAEGETVISDIKHIDRGYENIESALNSVGARISRVS